MVAGMIHKLIRAFIYLHIYPHNLCMPAFSKFSPHQQIECMKHTSSFSQY